MANLKAKLINFIQNKQNLLLLLIILSLTLFWRFFLLNSIPTGVSGGEFNLVSEAIKITQNGWKISPTLISNSFYLYSISLIGKLVHFKIVYLRAFQALIGFGTVFFFYEFVRNWFNRQTAMLAALLFSANAFHIALSREINLNILLPLVYISLFYLITNAFRTGKKYWFILGGISFGLSLYISTIFFIVPIFFAISAVYFYFKNNKVITNYLSGITLGVIAFLIVAIPYIYYLPTNFQQIIGTFNPGSIGHFYLNIGNLIQSLFYNAPKNFIINVGSEPFIDPFITVTFVAGFFYAIFHLKRKKFILIIGWLIALLALLGLQSNQDLSMLIILLPAIYTLSAVMMDYVLTGWIRTFPFNLAARLSITFVFSLFLFMSIFYNYQKYFYAFARNDDVKNQFKYQIEYNNK